MKTRKFLALAIAPLFAFGLAACDVDQSGEGELPDVNVEGGEVPEYDVETGDVDVGTDTTTVQTPDINVEEPAEDAGNMEGDVQTEETEL